MTRTVPPWSVARLPPAVGTPCCRPLAAADEQGTTDDCGLQVAQPFRPADRRQHLLSQLPAATNPLGAVPGPADGASLCLNVLPVRSLCVAAQSAARSVCAEACTSGSGSSTRSTPDPRHPPEPRPVGRAPRRARPHSCAASCSRPVLRHAARSRRARVESAPGCAMGPRKFAVGGPAAPYVAATHLSSRAFLFSNVNQ